MDVTDETSRQSHLGITSAKATDATSRSGLASLPSLERRRTNRLYFRLFAALVDVAAIGLAFVLASAIRFSDFVTPELRDSLAVILPVFMVVAVNQHAYEPAALVNLHRGTRKVVGAMAIALSFVFLAMFFFKAGADFSRALLGTGAVAALILIPLGRLCLSKLAPFLFNDTMMNEVVIQDGVPVTPSPGAVMIDAAAANIRPQLDDPAMMDRIGNCLRSADRVIVACPPERRRLWAATLKGADVNAEILAQELDELGALSFQTYNGAATLVVTSAPLGVVDRALKRSLDLAILSIGLPLVLPVMAVTAIAIRLDSPGPILFRQRRVGLGNRLFTLYKFRSMRVDQLDSSGVTSTQRGDKRITRVGAFIRRTSIDELPQLFNVLSGAMSIVGPRPHALGSTAEDRLFWDIDAAYWHRHAVKPGLTGLAQVRGYRGATERAEDLQQRLQADLEYLSGWSIWRDLTIIWSTFRVLVHRNAY